MSTSDGHTERQRVGTCENHLDSMFPEHASTEPFMLETLDEAVGLYDWDGWEPTDTSFDTECDDDSISFASNAPPRPSTPKYEDQGHVPSHEQLCLKYGTMSNISHISTLSSDVGCEIPRLKWCAIAQFAHSIALTAVSQLLLHARRSLAVHLIWHLWTPRAARMLYNAIVCQAHHVRSGIHPRVKQHKCANMRHARVTTTTMHRIFGQLTP